MYTKSNKNENRPIAARSYQSISSLTMASNQVGSHESTNSLRRPRPMLWLFEKPYTNEYIPPKGKKLKYPSTGWSVYRTTNKKINNKMYFSCNKVRPLNEQPTQSLFLLYDSTSERILRVRTSNDPHDGSKFDCQPDLPAKMKTEISKLFKPKMKPKNVIDCLHRMNAFPLPSKRQLADYITSLMQTRTESRHLRKSPTKLDVSVPRKNVTEMIDLKKLATLLEIHSKLPEDEHESYVVAHEVNSEEDDDPTFRFFISTRHLIEMAGSAKMIHASGAFNLSWQTFPMLVIGTTDKDSVFHPFGLFVAEQVQVNDYTFFFNELKNSVKANNNINMRPIFLMCNAEQPIQKAYKKVFGPNVLILTCWAHVRKQIIQKVLELIEAPKRMEILSDIDMLQLTARRDIFQQLGRYFLRKWRDESDFCSYFEKEWLNRNGNWFEGAAKIFPSTNNALEAFTIKVTNHVALQNQFNHEDCLTKLLEMVTDWSIEYKQGLKRVATVPTISQRLWTESYQWHKMPKSILKCKNQNNYAIYRISLDNKQKELTKPKQEPHLFNVYKRQYLNECEVALPMGNESWIKGTCNCPTFLKTFMCKHVLGMAIKLKDVNVPLKVRKESIGDSCKISKSDSQLL